jgi:MFS family permease
MNRYLLTTTGIPALALLATIIWSLTILGELPDPVASHFGADGRADGFSSPLTLILSLTVLGVLLLGLFAAIARSGFTSGVSARVMAGIGAGSVILLAALLALMLDAQRGLADAATATLGGRLPLAFGIAAAGGLLVALLARPVIAEAPQLDRTEIPLSDTSRAVWFGSARVSGWILVIFAAGAVVLLMAAVYVALEGRYLLAAILAVAFLPAILLTGVRVRVDAHGIHWRLLPGFPGATIPYSSVKDVSVVDMRPGDWGGWGWRFGPHGQALFFRSGEGLRIERTRGAAFHVSVDDASRGAALIRAYLDS